MKIESPVFNNNEIPSKYTCDGENISPPLKICDVPEGAASLVLIMEDPDAVGGNFVHWIVYNIDPKLSDVPENNFHNNEFHGINDFLNPEYGGPCPPSGVHHYLFKLYALDTMLTLYKPDIDELRDIMQPHVLASAELVGLYRRNKAE